jgi:hypothetical protein
MFDIGLASTARSTTSVFISTGHSVMITLTYSHINMKIAPSKASYHPRSITVSLEAVDYAYP